MSDTSTSSTELDTRSQFISLAVHELRTPASVVAGYLRMLEHDDTLTDRQRKMIGEAEKSCARIAEIIAELSDIGKAEAGILKLAQEPIDVFELAAEVAERVQEGRDRGVRLEVRGDATGGRTRGDAARLRKALDAIFRAILREKDGNTIVVADRRRDGRSSFLLVVAEEQSVAAAYESPVGALFEKRGGLGLALPLARRIIEVHGGEVWSPAAPEALEKGAILIRFPITE